VVNVGIFKTIAQTRSGVITATPNVVSTGIPETVIQSKLKIGPLEI
jgi:hypothetical protein